MATIAATAPRTRQAVSPGIWLPAYSLWQREIVRFYRQKARVAGVIASPLIFWVVLGAGFAHSFSTGSGSSAHYLGYFFPGSVAMIVLFTAIFSMMSLIQDRNEGFLLSVLAAPVSRSFWARFWAGLRWPPSRESSFSCLRLWWACTSRRRQSA
jgi:ABC-2 type transport system permease protein